VWLEFSRHIDQVTELPFRPFYQLLLAWNSRPRLSPLRTPESVLRPTSFFPPPGHTHTTPSVENASGSFRSSTSPRRDASIRNPPPVVPRPSVPPSSPRNGLLSCSASSSLPSPPSKLGWLSPFPQVARIPFTMMTKVQPDLRSSLFSRRFPHYFVLFPHPVSFSRFFHTFVPWMLNTHISFR